MFLLEDVKDMRCAKFATFKGKYTPFFLAPSFFPPEQQPPLGCIVDHGGNRSPWRRTCPSGHVEHPKNTVQESGVSLLTMGRKFRPTRSFHSVLPFYLISASFLFLPTFSPSSFPIYFCPFQTTEVNDGVFFRAPVEGKGPCIVTDIRNIHVTCNALSRRQV